MALRNYTIRALRRRKGRSLLTIGGVAIGVAAIVGVTVTIDSARMAPSRMFEALAGKADFEVVAASGIEFASQITDRVASTPGVNAAVPVVQKNTILLQGRTPTPVMLIGIDPELDRSIRSLELTSGAGLTSPKTVLLGVGVAANMETPPKEGDEIRLIAPSPRPLIVGGVLESKGVGAFNGGQVIVAHIDTVRSLFALGDHITSIQIAINDGADMAATRRSIEKALPTGLSIQTPAARAMISAEMLKPTEHGLAVLSVVSLVAGGAVILNAFLMNVTERRKELAIIRAIGATRKQVAKLLLRESILIGITGTIVGIPVGLCAAIVLTKGVTIAMGISAAGLSITIWPFLIAALLGPGIAIAATLWPVRTASRTNPLTELRDSSATSREKVARWPAILGTILLIAICLLVVALVQESIPRNIIAPLLPIGMAAGCAAIVMMTPISAPSLVRMASPIVSWLFRAEGRLATRQLLRRPTRAGLTISVLVVSTFVSVGYGHALLQSVQDIRDWAGAVGNVDYFVRSSLPDPGTMTMTVGVPATAQDELKGLDGIETSGRISFVPARIESTALIVIAVDMAGDHDICLDVIEGRSGQLKERLAAGEIAIGTALAQRLGVGIGDTVELATRSGPRTLKIVARITDYTAGGLNLTMNWQHAADALGFNSVHALFVNAKAGKREELGETLATLTGKHGLMLHSRATFLKMVDDYMAGVVGSLVIIMGMVFVVALMGIVNALSMSLLEQTREVGVLRAIAMSRRQLRRLVMGEALAIGIAALPLGILAGVGIGYLMSISTYAITGTVVSFSLQPVLIVAVAIVAVLTAVAAAWLPARRAESMSIISALQYE